MLLDKRHEMNIIIENFKKKLGLPIPRTTPYTLRMANQTMTRLIKVLINNSKIHVHGIPCISTMKNILLDDNYSMLLGDVHGCIMPGVIHD